MLRKMKIGTRIRSAREAITLNQTDLAKRLGVSQPTVSDWENGRTEPTVDNLRVLAVELEVYFEWLATGRGQREFKAGVAQGVAEYRVKKEQPADEAALIGIYKKLSVPRRDALLEFLKRFG